MRPKFRWLRKRANPFETGLGVRSYRTVNGAYCYIGCLSKGRCERVREERMLGDVFVVGRLPRITYNPRDELRLEQQLTDYLADRGTILSVSGPTKTGKTTLLRSVARDAVWLSGGAVASVENVWEQISAQFGLFTETTTTHATTDQQGRVKEGGGTIGVVGGKAQWSDATTQSSQSGQARNRSHAIAAREALRGSLHVLVIDDFHYVEPSVQLAIVRGVKDLVFDGLGVIFASVPHRAFDAVRVEKEMTGRVTHLGIDPWSEEDLLRIAQAGFAALNVKDNHDLLANRLAQESFASPHLMQEFCRRLCKTNGVSKTCSLTQNLSAPEDWTAFFSSTAVDTSKAAFDLLAKGPRQRTDRLRRTLADGRDVDIYGAVLAAIAHTGPALTIGYEQLRAAVRAVLKSDPPQRHEITRVLDQMTLIARDKVEGEPVLDYDEQLSTLHISDPYFAFYLRWGAGATKVAT